MPSAVSSQPHNNLRPFLPPPPILATELARTHSHNSRAYHHHPAPAIPALTEAIAGYYNQSTTDFTTSKHIVVGLHQKSLLFLLHLACKTFNECATRQQQRVTLRQHQVGQVLDKVSPAMPTSNIVHVLPIAFPDTCTNNQRATTLPRPCILVAEMPVLFTNHQWNGAFAVFPHLARSHEQTVHTALRNIVKELQTELGALPTLAVQRGMLLACSPMVLAYASKCHVLANGVNACIANELQRKANETGTLCTVTPTHTPYPNSTLGVTLHYDDVTLAEKLEFMLEQVFDSGGDDASVHWSRAKQDVLVTWSTTEDLSRAVHALPDADGIVDGVEMDWVAPVEFVEEWVGGVWVGVGGVGGVV
jgi:hypothetical protein